MNSLLLVEYLVIEMNVYRLDWRIESGELSNSVEEKKNLRFFKIGIQQLVLNTF